MRFVPAVLAAALLITSACKDDIEEIGKFTTQLNGNSVEFTSVFDITNDHSSIRQKTSDGTNMLMVEGFADITDGKPDFPIVSMSFQSGSNGGATRLMSVQVFDQSYETNLIAKGSRGYKSLDNFEMGEDGSISFDFSADLVRITTQSEEPVAGTEGGHIEGHFNGKIPASKMVQ